MGIHCLGGNPSVPLFEKTTNQADRHMAVKGSVESL